MPVLLTNAPERANAILESVSHAIGGDTPIATISDEDANKLPLLASLMHPISIATDVIGASLKALAKEETAFACIPIYGDGSAPQLLTIDDASDVRFVVAIIDLRFAYECLAHVCLSPLGSYVPSIEQSVALEHLASATRIASFGDRALRHLPLGLISEAQSILYAEGEESPAISLGRLMERSFLSEDQFSLIVQSVLFFQIFHEYGHHVCREQPANRAELHENLTNYFQRAGTNLQHQMYHDAQNSKLLQDLFGDEDVSAILTKDTSEAEYQRLVEARIVARQDREELLCDNYAVQNTAKLLVEGFNLGSSDWILVRYVLEFVLTQSWGVLTSKPIFEAACAAWNAAAKDVLSENARLEATGRLETLIEDRRKTILAQRFRLKYALEQYDAVMAILLHSALGSQVDIRSAIDRFSPSASMGRIMHQYSARHTNMVDRSLYTIGGLARCSGRGRALLSSMGELPVEQISFEDTFAYYVLGRGFRFDYPG